MGVRGRLNIRMWGSEKGINTTLLYRKQLSDYVTVTGYTRNKIQRIQRRMHTMLLEENLMSSIKKKEIKEKENSKELMENKLVNCFEIVILTNERE